MNNHAYNIPKKQKKSETKENETMVWVKSIINCLIF